MPYQALIRLATCLYFLCCLGGAVASADSQPIAPSHDAQPSGALTGATIFVSAGHGWYHNSERGQWMTQRGVSHGVLEDHSNAESVNQYLLPYLWNAGASVWPTRERDMQIHEVIVHHSDPVQFRMEGEWESEEAIGSLRGTQLVARSTRGEPESRATFVPLIPEEGMYAVYVRFAPSNLMRRGTSASTRFLVNHSGGTRVWVQDQNRHHSTWTYIGHYHFEAGTSPGRGSVVVTNQTDRRGEAVVVDAVRFGGGMGDAERGGSTSGKPRWEESGVYHALNMGMNPDETESRPFNTVSAMPLYSEWQMETWERGRAIYLAWHANASGQPGAPARGLFSFVYSPNSWESVENFTGFPGGDLLGLAVHNGIIRGVHSLWDPEWRDGGVVCRWLGETNPRNNNRMPAALTEVGFFDNEQDAAYILHPQFRRLAARGVYHGLVDYYATHVPGFPPAVYLPEPPEELRAVQQGDSLRFSWQAPPFQDDRSLGDRATSYRVYRSLNGYGFDAGMEVKSTNISLRDLPPDRVVYLRVTALNAGGESLPSETVAVRTRTGMRPEVLLVNGFNRLDEGLNTIESNGAVRGVLERMNTFDYSVQHGAALERAGVRFDYMNSKILERGAASIAGYKTVVWMAGRQGGSQPVFSDEEIRMLSTYLQGGGSLLLTGAHVASELDQDDVGRLFLQEALGARFVGTVESPSSAQPTDAGAFRDLGRVEFGGLVGRSYPIPVMDLLDPIDQTVVNMHVTGQDNDVVGVQQSKIGKSVFLTVPFESIDDSAMRAAIMERAMQFLGSREPTASQIAQIP